MKKRITRGLELLGCAVTYCVGDVVAGKPVNWARGIAMVVIAFCVGYAMGVYETSGI